MSVPGPPVVPTRPQVAPVSRASPGPPASSALSPSGLRPRRAPSPTPSPAPLAEGALANRVSPPPALRRMGWTRAPHPSQPFRPLPAREPGPISSPGLGPAPGQYRVPRPRPSPRVWPPRHGGRHTYDFISHFGHTPRRQTPCSPTIPPQPGRVGLSRRNPLARPSPPLRRGPSRYQWCAGEPRWRRRWRQRRWTKGRTLPPVPVSGRPWEPPVYAGASGQGEGASWEGGVHTCVQQSVPS